jgi:DNA-binding PadR family transcriptional regulator
VIKLIRSKLETCMDILNSLRGSDGKCHTNISTICNIAVGQKTIDYLNFLEKNQYASSREPSRNEKANGPIKKMYFLTEKGIQLVKGWEEYSTKFDIDGLREELSKL